jgi:long-chain acyl-CoA synthetase
MLVQEFLERSAERTPEKTALVCGSRHLSYAEIDDQANRLAVYLIDHGLQRGDRVAIYLPNCVEAVISLFGALKAGGVFVMVNATTKFDKLVTILNDCGAAAIISNMAGGDAYQALQAAVPSLQILIHTDHRQHVTEFAETPGLVDFSAVMAANCQHKPVLPTIDLDLACLVYTSGSTGDSKGVMCDHSNVDFAADSIITYLGNTADDIVLNCLPLSFDYGLYQLLMVFKFGGTLVLEKGFVFPAVILQQIQRERVTGFPGVPTMFAILTNTDLSSYDLSSLRYLTNTAAALPVSHIQALREKFPQAQLFSMYGLTETKRTLYLPPDELDRRPGSVGIAIPGTEVWLEDEDGKRLGAGQIGELVVRGRHVMRGYWNAPEATAARYRPGALPHERVCYTGDLFRRDEEGYYYFVSRKDDIIKSRGEKVSPVELERVLYGIPGVTRAAVIGVSDGLMGEAIKVFVVCTDPALSEKDVLIYCRDHVEDYMVPKYVEFRTELPMTESGKILKSALT